MCMEGFEKFIQLDKSEPVTGYRSWSLLINESLILISPIKRNSKWEKESYKRSHEVTEENSGIYSYNYNYYNNYYDCNNYNYYYNNYNYNYNYNNYNYYDYNNNYYNDYNYNYYSNYNYNYYNNYRIGGIVKQYGRVAIHTIGYRSEFVEIDTLFTIRESNAKGPDKFLDWISKFNKRIEDVADYYECKTMHHQDFVESQKG